MTGTWIYKIGHGKVSFKVQNESVDEYWKRISPTQNSPISVYSLHGLMYIEMIVELPPLSYDKESNPCAHWLSALVSISRPSLTFFGQFTQMELSSVFSLWVTPFIYWSLWRAHSCYSVFQYSDPSPCLCEIETTGKSCFKFSSFCTSGNQMCSDLGRKWRWKDGEGTLRCLKNMRQGTHGQLEFSFFLKDLLTLCSCVPFPQHVVKLHQDYTLCHELWLSLQWDIGKLENETQEYLTLNSPFPWEFLCSYVSPLHFWNCFNM